MRWFGVRLAFAVLLLAAYFLLEVGARLYVAYGLGIADRDYSRFYRSNPFKIVAWGNDFESHPYLGYISPAMARSFAVLRGQRDPADYVIAILGGSVAEHFGHYINQHPQTIEKLRPLIPAIGNRPIRLFTFATGGYKQPQQFILASYLLEYFNMTINIDGYNEMNVGDLYPAYPTDFPAKTLTFYGHDDAPRINPILAGMARFAARGLNGLPLKVPLLSTSSIYFLIWRGFNPLLYRALHGLEDRSWRRSAPWQRWGTSRCKPQAGGARSRSGRYARLQDEIAKRAGVSDYFFLQPNECLRAPGHSLRRRTVSAINPQFADRGDAEMKLLQAAAQGRAAHGLAVVDLTRCSTRRRTRPCRDAPAAT